MNNEVEDMSDKTGKAIESKEIEEGLAKEDIENIIEKEAIGGYKYRVAKVDNIVNVYNSLNKIVYKNKDASLAIQYALSHLTSGRKSQEKVRLETELIMNSAVNTSSFTFLEITGVLKQRMLNHDLINLNNKHDVTISGGELVGLGSNNGKNGWGIRTTGSNKQNYNITIENLKAHDFRSSGIALNQSKKNGLVQNCICNNNGLNGIGFGDDIGIVAKNNYCEGNRDSGLNIEDVWNFEFIDNSCVKNGRHNLQVEHGETGSITNGIYTDSGGDGINIRNRANDPKQISKDIKVIGADGHNNATNGLTIISSEKISVKDNKFNNNGEYGVEEQSGDYNEVIANDLRNNGKEEGFKIVGDHSIAKDNII